MFGSTDYYELHERKCEFLAGSYIWVLEICIYKRFPLHCSEEHIEYEIRMAVHLRKRKKTRKLLNHLLHVPLVCKS